MLVRQHALPPTAPRHKNASQKEDRVQRLQQPQAVRAVGPIRSASMKTSVSVQTPAELVVVGKVDRFEQAIHESFDRTPKRFVQQ
jgi:hypothetical protein